MATTIEGQMVVTPADWVPGPKQGHWTYEHYAALDDGQRYEIIDGVLYAMAPAPNWSHQRSVSRFFKWLSIHVEDTNQGEVLFAPFDVELAPDAVMQPDVMVVLNAHRDKIISSHMVGAPDLVVEVLSRSTAKHDRHEKRKAYARAGVPEYWIADPIARSIEVLILEGGVYHSQGVFKGQETLRSKVVPNYSRSSCRAVLRIGQVR
jgi:Uma2 family endonuclease